MKPGLLARDRRPSGRRDTVARGVSGPLFDPLTFAYSSAELRSFATVVDATVDSGFVTQLTDRTAFGNNWTVSAACATGPTVESGTWRGNDCLLFNGVDQGLHIDSLNWGTGAVPSGSCTIVLLIQQLASTTSCRPFVVGNNAPLFSTTNGGLSFRADNATNPALAANCPYGRSCIVGQFDVENGLQSMWAEGVKTHEVEHADPGNIFQARNVTLGHEGSRTVATPGKFVHMRLRGLLFFKGALTDFEHAKIAAWAEAEKGAYAVPTKVDIGIKGQSNCVPEGLDMRAGIFLPRRDITYSKNFEKASVGTPEVQNSGALTWAREVVFDDYLGSGLLWDLHDLDRINASLITAGRTGTGFMSGNPGSNDLWAPPSSNGGVGGTIYNRAVSVWNTNNRSAGLNVLLHCFGETDAYSPNGATNFQTNLENLIDDFLNDLDGWTVDNVLVLLVGLTPEFDDLTGGSRRTAVRAAQEAVAAARSYVKVINADGTGLQPDDTHYSAAMCDAIITAVRLEITTALGL